MIVTAAPVATGYIPNSNHQLTDKTIDTLSCEQYMDLTDFGSGQRTVSRRRLIQGLVGGVGGSTAVAIGGYQVVSSAKDEKNDETDEAAADSASSSGDSPPDPDGQTDHTKSVVSQVDLTERDGRVTVRLGVYERVVADFNRNGEAVGDSAWRVDGSLAARSGVSFRTREDNTVQLTLQNPTPIPYSFSIHSSSSDEGRLAVDSRGVTVSAGDIERLQLADLSQGEYSYRFETPTRPLEPLAGRLLVDRDPSVEDGNATNN